MKSVVALNITDVIGPHWVRFPRLSKELFIRELKDNQRRNRFLPDPSVYKIRTSKEGGIEVKLSSAASA